MRQNAVENMDRYILYEIIEWDGGRPGAASGNGKEIRRAMDGDQRRRYVATPSMRMEHCSAAAGGGANESGAAMAVGYFIEKHLPFTKHYGKAQNET